MKIKTEIKNLLRAVTPSEAIAILESIGKEYRRANSIRINNQQMGRLKVEERPDELIMKEK